MNAVPPTVLLYTPRGDIDEYERLLMEARLPGQLLVCRSEAELEAAIGKAEIVFGVRLPPKIYARAERLRWIQSMWAGVEDLISVPVPPEVIITRPVGVFSQSISQYVFGYLLASYIKLREGLALQAERRWRQYQVESLAGARLGIAGVGNIGSELARIGKGFHMEVWGLSRSLRSHEFVDRGFATDGIGQFAAGVDALVIILPSTPETRGLFSREVLAKMRPHALLINVGRGAVLDEAALVELLEERRIGGAVLDVFTQEPLPPEHPFWQLPNCIVTPHVGGPSLPRDITHCFLENYQRFLAGEPLFGQVSRQRGY